MVLPTLRERPRGATRRSLGVVAAVLVIIGVGVSALLIAAVRTPATETTSVDTLASPPIETRAARGAVYVHVSGAVERPGLYVLDEGARVVDAVSAAGGLTDAAEAAAVNLARVVADGEQLHVPEVGEAAPAGGTSGAGAPSPIDLNTADAGTLDTLPGIGPALAERIILWREENGPFRVTEDLLAVSGIGEKVLDGLTDLVVP